MCKLAIILGTTLLCASTLAQASSSTGNLGVSAIVTSTCSVQSAALLLNNQAARQTAQVGVNCSAGTAYTVSYNNSGTESISSNTGNGNQQNVPIYGAIPSAQNISAGNFNDVVGITLSY